MPVPRHVRPSAAALVVFLAAATTSACAPAHPGCTAKGADSGVTAEVANAVLPAGALSPVSTVSPSATEPALHDTGLVVEICRESTCARGPLFSDAREADASPATVLLDPGKVPTTVTVSVRPGAGGAPLHGPTMVQIHPVVVDVNGGGCGPMVNQARVRVDTSGIHEESIGPS